MGKKKIINDPIYGLISFPFEILYSLIDHPYFQRLRRITQMGLSHYVYPGATHSRFHHALGALHLMTQAVETLRWKGVEITDEEAEAVCIAILLHDIGHGPYSHALENIIVPLAHEDISMLYMEQLNLEYEGRLSTAISIFKNSYSKPFLYQLVSGQLDMDRMDYLMRDSYYSGVAEGVVGYDRIIKMLNVKDGKLVVEEKGIYSVEKFLMSRRIMYFQVYLHKTSIVSEQILRLFIANYLTTRGSLQPSFAMEISSENRNLFLHEYSLIDDSDIVCMLKKEAFGDKPLLCFLANALLNRKLLSIRIQDIPFSPEVKKKYKAKIELLDLPDEVKSILPLDGVESNLAYDVNANEIIILQKDGKILRFAEASNFPQIGMKKYLYYLAFPKSKDF
jgi:HD superfamily phosphohydrolase